jgi:Protein of unknown function (DUF3054)
VKFWSSALADVIAITGFAVIGRSSHGEMNDLAGTWHTAWPFLAGAAVGTLVSRAWRKPGAIGNGVLIWACTLIGGMALRVLSGGTIAWSFVIVAGLVLATFLLGWRAVYARVRRARARSDATV